MTNFSLFAGMNFAILVAMRYIQGRVLGSLFIPVPSLAYLLILHCWDGYRRGAKGMLVPGYQREVTAHTASYTNCRQGSEFAWKER